MQVNEGDIVVTARRRDETLSTVPAAITALSSDDLVQRGVHTDADLQLVAPGLTIRQTQGNNSLTYSIRGQTADTFSGSPSAVIAYLNEVPMAINGARLGSVIASLFGRIARFRRWRREPHRAPAGAAAHKERARPDQQ